MEGREVDNFSRGETHKKPVKETAEEIFFCF